MLLAVLWASQANTVPTAFWAVGFLLLPENRKYAEEVRRVVLLGDSALDRDASSAAAALAHVELLPEAEARLTAAACNAVLPGSAAPAVSFH